MRVEDMDNGYKIFVHNLYFSSIDWHDKIEIENSIREVLTLVCNHYKITLSGFYRIKIFPHKVGIFMEILQIDDESYDGCEVNFRIVVVFNQEMYLKLDDYDYFLEYDKLYFDNYYYINLNEVDDYLKVSDFGEIVSSDNIDFGKSLFIFGKKNKT